MAQHNDVGRLGEELARAFLIGKGHQLLHSNFRMGHAEVDLITIHNNRLVFTEVKTREAKSYYYPEESVDAHKEKMLIDTMELFLEDNGIDLEPRFDIIAVRINGPDHEIYHFEDAF
ncbi:MAG: YraN family protein [Chitinophagales bacterium]